MTGEPAVVIRLSRRAILISAAVVLIAATAAATALTLSGTPGRQQVVLSSGSTTVPSTVATSEATGSSVPGQAQGPSSTVPSSATGSSMPNQGQTALTGRVTDSAGNPVAGAYVIGLDSLTVVQTDSSGQFSMPCELSTNGVEGSRSEPLVAASWLLPVEAPGQGSYALGRNTTDYGPPPSTPGPGYVFSGGAATAAGATPASCNGQAHDFVLGPGGSVDVQVLDHSGNPVSSSVEPPPDNFYLPGLEDHAALETVPLSANGHQLLAQLGTGELRIDGTNSTLDCSGPSVSSDQSIGGADVAVVAGQTVDVVCRQS